MTIWQTNSCWWRLMLTRLLNSHHPDHIQWQTFCLAYNWFKKTDRKIIIKYNHNWLPLQMSHHVHSTSEQQYCPSCLGQPETTDHFLQCPQPDRNQHWIEYHELLLKHCIRNPIPPELNELLLAGLRCSRLNDATIPLHLSQNQQLTFYYWQTTSTRLAPIAPWSLH